MTDLNTVLTIRGQRYGPFDGHAELSQLLKISVRGHDNGAGWGRMTAAQREAMDMILHKVARIVNGDPDYTDSWTDIAGYAQRTVQAIEEAAQKRVAVLKP